MPPRAESRYRRDIYDKHSKMYGEIRRPAEKIREMHKYFEQAPKLSDPLMNAPHVLHGLDLIIGPCRVADGARNAITRNARLRAKLELIVKDSSEYIDLDLMIGHHLVTNVGELIERAARGTVKIIYPYFVVTYRKLSDNKLTKILDKYHDSPSIRCFDIPSIIACMSPTVFARYPIFRECPLRPFVCVETFSPAVRSVVDIDGINDMIERDGWTPEHLGFAWAQRMSDEVL